MTPDVRRAEPRQAPLDVDQAATKQLVGRNGTARRPERLALGTAHAVVSGRGVRRFVIVVDCLFCGCKHVAHAAVLEDGMRRRAACGGGWLVLVPQAHGWAS